MMNFGLNFHPNMNERPGIIALSDEPNILFIGCYFVLGLKAVVSIENDEDVYSF